jgi:hypothetical protein
MEEFWVGRAVVQGTVVLCAMAVQKDTLPATMIQEKINVEKKL